MSTGAAELFLSLAGKGRLPITDEKMTRFMVTLEQAVELVWRAFDDMEGGEIYVKKLPSMRVADIALAIDPLAELETVGFRPGEKLHEQMIGVEDARHTYEYNGYFKILPTIDHAGIRLPEIDVHLIAFADFILPRAIFENCVHDQGPDCEFLIHCKLIS